MTLEIQDRAARRSTGWVDAGTPAVPASFYRRFGRPRFYRRFPGKVNGLTESRTRVTLFTGTYRIKGFIDLLPGARVTDFMNEAKAFIAVTDAEVWEIGDRRILSAPFLDVGRDPVEFVIPDH